MLGRVLQDGGEQEPVKALLPDILRDHHGMHDIGHRKRVDQAREVDEVAQHGRPARPVEVQHMKGGRSGDGVHVLRRHMNVVLRIPGVQREVPGTGRQRFLKHSFRDLSHLRIEIDRAMMAGEDLQRGLPFDADADLRQDAHDRGMHSLHLIVGEEFE